jgi:uncharacterized transporter YbjL
LKKEGLPLNLMAAAIIGLGVLTTIAVMRIGNIPPAVAAGLFSGATTNTPSLAAAQQALQDTPGLGAEVAKLPGLGYAVAYPFGIMGIILTMLLIKSVFRVRVADEVSAIDAQQKSTTPPIESRSLEVRNPEFNGCERCRCADARFFKRRRIAHHARQPRRGSRAAKHFESGRCRGGCRHQRRVGAIAATVGRPQRCRCAGVAQ